MFSLLWDASLVVYCDEWATLYDSHSGTISKRGNCYPGDYIRCAVYSPDGSYLLLGSKNTLYIFESKSDLTTPVIVKPAELGPRGGYLTSVAWSHNDVIAYATSDPRVVLWNFRDNARPSRHLSGLEDVEWPRVLFSPDGGLLVVYDRADRSTVLGIYDANMGECLYPIKLLRSDPVQVFGVSSDRREIFTDQGILSYNHNGTGTHDAPHMKPAVGRDIHPKHTYYLEDGDRWIMDHKQRRICRLPIPRSIDKWPRKGLGFSAWGDKAVIADGDGQVLILHLRALDGET